MHNTSKEQPTCTLDIYTLVPYLTCQTPYFCCSDFNIRCLITLTDRASFQTESFSQSWYKLTILQLTIQLNLISNINWMGQIASLCGGDVFKELQQKYGQTFVKLMVAQKSKEIVNQQFGQLTNQSNEVFQGFTNKTAGMVDEKSNALNGIFQDLKNQVNKVPGGIPAIEKMKGQSINEFSGFNSLQNQITSVKTQAFQKIQGEKSNVLNELNSKKSGMLSQIQQERPKIPLYQQLPDPLKGVVLNQAETTFASQIDQNKGAILQSISQQFNINNLQGIFSKISPENTLNGIVGGATGQITSALGLGNLGSLAGGLGGLGNMIGGGGGSIPFFGR